MLASSKNVNRNMLGCAASVCKNAGAGPGVPTQNPPIL